MLSERRDLAAAGRFFKQVIDTNGVPDRVVNDKSSANLASLQAVNVILKFTDGGHMIRKGQIPVNGANAFQTLAALAA